MLLTITRIGTTGPIVVGGAVGVLAPGVASRSYDLSVDKIEQLGPTLTRLADAGLITWSTSASTDTGDDAAEAITKTYVDAAVAAAIEAALATLSNIFLTWKAVAQITTVLGETRSQGQAGSSSLTLTENVYPITAAKRLLSVHFRVTSNTLSTTATATCTIMKNGVPTALFHTVAAGVNDDATVSAIVDYAPGDTFQIQTVTAAGGVVNQTAIFTLWLEWDPTL